MKNYSKLNNIFGWLSFLIAAVVYLLTIEPTTSLWDCGEFIATAFKLQVGHPPGAPFFMILARFFSLFASDVDKVAMMVNSLSALMSAFTILFLFWTITYFAKRIVALNSEPTSAQGIAILGAGLVGALAYTFSDTFWFSAVEGEVYASSSLFTALVFWAIIKWERVSEEKYANRWIILIAYLVGLSIGVHLLNLLAIPAIALVYYFKKYPINTKGLIAALGISIVILAAIMYGIIPGIVKMASKFELLFVNGFGMGFKSGVVIFAILLIGSLIFSIYYTTKEKTNPVVLAVLSTVAILLIGIPLIADNVLVAILILGGVFATVYYAGNNNKPLINMVLTGFAVIIIGYSSFAMIVIRSAANPPMDENNPETVFSLLSYLNREQYGDRPLFYGQFYNAPVTSVEDGDPVYTQIGDRYEITDYKLEVEYDERFLTLFPRMYSSQGSHVNEYKKWAEITKGKKVTIRNNQGENETVTIPTMGQNLRFFFRYQVGFMYFRYFFWNFTGRQDDIQSHGGLVNGNAITGIPFVDKALIGPQENMPDWVANHPARNRYYALPFLLGFLGLLFQANRRKEGFWIVMSMFILTGLAIVIYLNQNPLQPRERDYAYAGSFYAFTIWIGLGALAVFDFLSKKLNKKASAVIATVVCLGLVPGIMASENWDDHDRSGRYTARDFAYNYLMTCPKNSILFTNGDNDTFPLWYIQEVEGVRTDVRVVNLMLLNTDWYIDQMKRKAYDSDPIPSFLTKDQYRQGTRDRVYVQERPEFKDGTELGKVMEFIASDDPRTKVGSYGGDKFDYAPTKNLKLNVDKNKVVQSGTVSLKDTALIPDEITWRYKRNHIGKSELMVLDILAHNNWERPVFFVSIGHEGTVGLEDYLQFDGFAYRLTPIKTTGGDAFNKGRIDTDVLYENLMEKYKWGRMDQPDVHLDHFNQRTLSVVRFRNMYTRLANALTEKGETDKAVEALDYCLQLGSHEKVPYDFNIPPMIEAYYKALAFDKGNALAEEYTDICDQNLNYYFQFSGSDVEGVMRELGYNLQMMDQMMKLANQYNQTEMFESIRGKFDKHYQTYRNKVQ